MLQIQSTLAQVVQFLINEQLTRLLIHGYRLGQQLVGYGLHPLHNNGIEELATRGDSLDRAIIIYLPGVSKKQRLEGTVF